MVLLQHPMLPPRAAVEKSSMIQFLILTIELDFSL